MGNVITQYKNYNEKYVTLPSKTKSKPKKEFQQQDPAKQEFLYGMTDDERVPKDLEYLNNNTLQTNPPSDESRFDEQVAPKKRGRPKGSKNQPRSEDWRYLNNNTPQTNPPSDESIEEEEQQESEEDWEPQPKKARKQKRRNTIGSPFSSLRDDAQRRDCDQLHRWMPCGECRGCVRPNCGECDNCRDMPRYGGQGRNIQKCQARACRDRVKGTCENCEW